MYALSIRQTKKKARTDARPRPALIAGCDYSGTSLSFGTFLSAMRKKSTFKKFFIKYFYTNFKNLREKNYEYTCE